MFFFLLLNTHVYILYIVPVVAHAVDDEAAEAVEFEAALVVFIVWQRQSIVAHVENGQIGQVGHRGQYLSPRVKKIALDVELGQVREAVTHQSGC